MTTLLELHDSDVFPRTQNLDPAGFSTRQASRAVLMNTDGRIALMRVGNLRYHKLPGGGLEPNEDPQTALARELLEEVGSHAEILQEVGAITEFKNEQYSKQVSYCWLARLIGEAEEPTLTDKEKENGLEVIWVDSLPDAIRLLEQDCPTDYTGKFIRLRDMAFLKAARALLEQ